MYETNTKKFDINLSKKLYCMKIILTKNNLYKMLIKFTYEIFYLSYFQIVLDQYMVDK